MDVFNNISKMPVRFDATRILASMGYAPTNYPLTHTVFSALSDILLSPAPLSKRNDTFLERCPDFMARMREVQKYAPDFFQDNNDTTAMDTAAASLLPYAMDYFDFDPFLDIKGLHTVFATIQDSSLILDSDGTRLDLANGCYTRESIYVALMDTHWNLRSHLLHAYKQPLPYVGIQVEHLRGYESAVLTAWPSSRLSDVVLGEADALSSMVGGLNNVNRGRQRIKGIAN